MEFEKPPGEEVDMASWVDLQKGGGREAAGGENVGIEVGGFSDKSQDSLRHHLQSLTRRPITRLILSTLLILLLIIFHLLFKLSPSKCFLRESDGRVACVEGKAVEAIFKDAEGWKRIGGDIVTRKEEKSEKDRRDALWEEMMERINCGKVGGASAPSDDWGTKYDEFKILLLQHMKQDAFFLSSFLARPTFNRLISRRISETLHARHRTLITRLLDLSLRESTNFTHARCAMRHNPASLIADADQCSAAPGMGRYAHLLNASATSKTYIAMNVHNNEQVLSDIMMQLMRLVHALGGPSRVFVAVYESNSKDATAQMLKMWDTVLTALGIPHWVQTAVTPEREVNRIVHLAEVRNKALEPLINMWEKEGLGSGSGPEKWSRIAFMNDVMFCAEDVLELLHQSTVQDADITCGLDYDWTEQEKAKGEGPGFYDTWVARNLDGQEFLKSPWNAFTSSSLSDARLMQNLPFQAQCCWNGGAILRPTAILRDRIRFRSANLPTHECAASECSLLCNDFIRSGWDRVLVVPNVKYAYEKEVHEEIMKRVGVVEYPAWAEGEMMSLSERVVWRKTPEKVRCLGLNDMSRSPSGEWVESEVVRGRRIEEDDDIGF
ncbi:capsular associated protein [Borealophlyctis nickersoniae]|nr:capsular associated protein [Borealophlyctis nickersoniae]